MMKQEVKDYMSELGKKGGKALWEGVSREERKRIMSERRKKGIANKKALRESQKNIGSK